MPAHIFMWSYFKSYFLIKCFEKFKQMFVCAPHSCTGFVSELVACFLLEKTHAYLIPPISAQDKPKKRFFYFKYVTT